MCLTCVTCVWFATPAIINYVLTYWITYAFLYILVVVSLNDHSVLECFSLNYCFSIVPLSNFQEASRKKPLHAWPRYDVSDMVEQHVLHRRH